MKLKHKKVSIMSKKKLESVPLVAAPQARDMQAINAEFSQQAVAIGDKKFKIKLMSEEIEQHLERMTLLNKEANQYLELQRHAATQAVQPQPSGAI